MSKSTNSELAKSGFVAYLTASERIIAVANEILWQGFNKGPQDWRKAARITAVRGELKRIHTQEQPEPPVCGCHRSVSWFLERFEEGEAELFAIGQKAATKLNDLYLEWLDRREASDLRRVEVAYYGEGEIQPRAERLIIDAAKRVIKFNVHLDFGVCYCEPAEPVIAEKPA
jgi:hypothetical protein